MNTEAAQSERVLIDDRPHIAFVLTQMWKQLVVMLLAWGGLRWLGGMTGEAVYFLLSWVPLTIVTFRLLLGVIDWLARRHILTDTRIVAASGILRRVRVELPLSRVHHTILVRPLGEQIMGLGSIGVTSAGTGGVDLVWRGVEHPERVLDTIRAQVERMSTHGTGKQVTPIIGIVGGIGAGKSTVAREFEQLGCVISDSDACVRGLMSTDRVRSQLYQWWGDAVLGSDGQLDRSAIARIVFDDERERRRLEGFIHPLVHEERHKLIRAAREEGAEGVIVDAPLLFEAGVDSECDAIVFVDTPHEIRLSRVKSTRGWDESELDRRENAQLGLEEKRKRSDYVIGNNGMPDELHGRVARVLASIQRDLRSRHSRG